ncbi:MAG: hypothetical protein ACJ0BJ_06455 [Pirellulales bacterium]
MRIVLCYPAESRHIEQIQAVYPDATVVSAGQERIAEELPNADIFCGHAKVPVPWEDTVKAATTALDSVISSWARSLSCLLRH